MADIRIKDLATTATTTASDDFMAVDGAINGTRKLSAATPSFLTSVTTPSLTSPASTNLTLGLGTGGTALTLANSTLAATFAGAVTVSTSGAGQLTAATSGTDRAEVLITKSTGTAQTWALSTAGSANGYSSADRTFNITNTTNGVVPFSISAGSLGSTTVNFYNTGATTFAGAVTVNGTLTNTAAQLGTFTSTTANGTSGEGVFSVVGSNTNTNIAYGINRAPGIAINNTSGTANSYGGISFQDGGGNATSSIFGIFENDANNTGSLQFATRPSGGSLTTALTLASTGAATFAGAVTMGAWPIIGNDGNAAYILQSAATITAYTGGGSVGTLTNAPSAGNPTKWITINDNGTLRQIPTWN